MMRNVNQWSGVVALIAVGCLVAFGVGDIPLAALLTAASRNDIT